MNDDGNDNDESIVYFDNTILGTAARRPTKSV